MESKLKLFSKGIVARSKELGNNTIIVTPYEHLAAINGDINSDVHEYIDVGTDSNGDEYRIPIQTSNTVTADWYDIGGRNTETAPDVVVGEEVLLYRYGNLDSYKWTSLGTHPRRLETVVKRYSNNRDASNNVLDESNSYWTKLSTHEKVFIFKTAANDGEVCVFTVYLDTKNGTAGIQDDKGNSISLDSQERIIDLRNGDGTLVTLDKTTLNIFAVDAINIETKTLTTKADTINTVAKSLNENIDDISIKGDSLKVEIANVSYTSENYNVTASFSINGNFAAVDGTFTHDGINLDGMHLHEDGTGAMGNTGVVFPG